MILRRWGTLRLSLIALLVISLLVSVVGVLGGSLVTAVVGGACSLSVCVVGRYLDNWSWTGFGEYRRKRAPNEDIERSKTLWDFLQLLIVPLALAALGYWVTDRRNTADRIRNDQLSKDTALDTYLDHMSDLVLKGVLSSRHPGLSLRMMARARTVTAVQRLDSERNRLLTQFLDVSRLLPKVDRSAVDLSHAQLDGANLEQARLSDDGLFQANLQSADLRGANLFGARLFCSR